MIIIIFAHNNVFFAVFFHNPRKQILNMSQLMKSTSKLYK